MTLKEIYDKLDEISPFDLQEPWDNSGVQISSTCNDIKDIYLSLDIDDEVIKSAKENSLIITHHPLIFKGLKSINNSYPSRYIRELIAKNIALISMHTNFDKTHLGLHVAQEILHVEVKKADGFLIYFDVDCTFAELVQKIKNSMNINTLHVVKGKTKIKTCALCVGSGGDFVADLEVDCFVSGDFKYHQAMEAKSKNLALIDIGHFQSEQFFAQILAKNLENSALKAIITNSKNPFEYK